MSEFKLQAPYQPTGDQPQAIDRLSVVFGRAISVRHFWVLPDPERHLRWQTSFSS